MSISSKSLDYHEEVFGLALIYYHLRLVLAGSKININVNIICDINNELIHSPVSILSLTIQLPANNTASQCITHPWVGITRISPGTKSLVDTLFTISPSRYMLATSLIWTVLHKLR